MKSHKTDKALKTMSKKFSPMRFTAATEEAAIEGALQLVGAARDEISYDFISQTAKGVTIRIRPFEPEAEPAVAATPIEVETDDEDESDAPLHIDSMHDFDDVDDDAHEAVDTAATSDEDDESDDENEDSDESDSDDELDFDASLELADDEYDSDDDDAEDEDETDDFEEPEIEIDAEMLERALTLARAMLDKMGLDAQVSQGQATAADIVPISIEGADVGILIGKHGATLQSFQYLMNLTLNNKGENTMRVSVDAGDYRARRQESLEAVARGAAQRARREGRPIKMEPMPSNERRIVHDILQSEPGVSTQSEGREPYRCVIVAPGQSDYSGAHDNRSRRGMGGYTRGRGGRNRR